MSTQADEFRPEMPEPPRPERSIGQLFARLSDQISTLVRGEMELAKTEAISKVTKLGIGGVLLALAGILGLYFLGLLFNSLAYAFAILVGNALGFLCAAGVLLIIILILAGVGLAQIKKSKQHTVDPKSGLKESVSAFTTGVKEGVKKQ